MLRKIKTLSVLFILIVATLAFAGVASAQVEFEDRDTINETLSEDQPDLLNMGTDNLAEVVRVSVDGDHIETGTGITEVIERSQTLEVKVRVQAYADTEDLNVFVVTADTNKNAEQLVKDLNVTLVKIYKGDEDSQKLDLVLEKGKNKTIGIGNGANDVSMLKMCKITMTLTSATCSFSSVIVDLVKSIVSRQDGLENIDVDIVFDPPWGQDSMSDEAKLAMGLL